MEKTILLTIETSCDETAASVVSFYKDKPHSIVPLSSVVASQIKTHAKYGGVFPELASRLHIEKISPVVEEALKKAKITTKDVSALAVTVGPGLIGSLIVGVEFARGFAMAHNLPVIALNHLEGHLFASYANKVAINDNGQANARLPFVTAPFLPALALIVSGGHTMLVLIDKKFRYKLVGQTLDDAAGEAFDKIARMLGLPYPGGPALSSLARQGNSEKFIFPVALMQKDNDNFSFSGLKTAVYYKLRSLGLVNQKAEPVSSKNNKRLKSDIAASAQKAIVEALVKKTMNATLRLKVKTILGGGGVMANTILREQLIKEAQKNKLTLRLSPIPLCTDNALSMAIAGAYRMSRGDIGSWQTLESYASLPLKSAISLPSYRSR